VQANSQTTQEILTLLQAYAEALASRDITRLLDLHADDADVVMFGSGADERRVGKAAIRQQAERDWSQSDQMTLRYDWTSVSAAAQVAWASTELTVSVSAQGKALTLPARFSVICEQRKDRWYIVQGHFSLPANDQASGQSFPAQAKA
jgi:ketosteroid isomerase-like protein